MDFSTSLIMYRKKAGYKTGKDLANALGISYPSYMAFENKGREPKYETLCKIADALHVTTDELLGHKLGDAFSYCKNLIESFEYEYMDVIEEPGGSIGITTMNDQICRFQSKKEFVDYVLAWEKSFPDTDEYKIYFNMHMYEAMLSRFKSQQRNTDRLYYIKESLDIIADDTRPETKKELKAILTQAMKAMENQTDERSADNE